MPKVLQLASKSPRRRELLDQLGIKYSIVDVNVDEGVLDGEVALDYVKRVATRKSQVGLEAFPGKVTLGADTAVVLSGDIMGKPRDERHAREMLRQLSGKVHQVMTAVCFSDTTRSECRVSVVDVWFRHLSDEDIDRYISMGESWDKAGAYAIQGLASAFIERIDGSYSAVVGLPLFETAELCSVFSIPYWQSAK